MKYSSHKSVSMSTSGLYYDTMLTDAQSWGSVRSVKEDLHNKWKASRFHIPMTYFFFQTSYPSFYCMFTDLLTTDVASTVIITYKNNIKVRIWT